MIAAWQQYGKVHMGRLWKEWYLTWWEPLGSTGTVEVGKEDHIVSLVC